MANTKVISYVGWILIAAALGFYIYGIGSAIFLSWSGKEIGENAYPAVLASTMGSMQALLLANLGMVLGISIAKPNSALANSVLLNSRTATQGQLTVPPPLEVREMVQLFALVIYLFALIGCLITWIHRGFAEDSKNIVALIAESGKMFIGVVLAYLTAVLSK